ncbi:DUF3419 family protein [Bartonella sp. HY038]|uniref:DUF3419 family protein n=1 Tax=Bartonella sp. HY038 TaxID=2759660 RepID=UPI0015FC6C99|nr:DUF3419 family protein [Bartonella sp. HY038]
MSFFNNLNFSSSNEDGKSELQALQDVSQSLLCLTGSGTRPLDMLFTNAQEVIALDLSFAQNAMLMLKMLAIKTLDYDDYLSFVGLLPAKGRLNTYHLLRGELTAEARDYWDKNTKLIKNGIWYCGLWEKVLNFTAKTLRVMKGKAVNALFAASTLEEQQAIWNREFNQGIWRSGVKFLSHRFIWTHIIGEPGGAFIPSREEVEKQLAQKFQNSAGEFFFRDSDFASLMLRGYHDVSQGLPYHMAKDRYQSLRDNLPKMKIVNGGLHQLPEMNLGLIDGFSISDFGSYCTLETYKACWQGVISSASKDAIFCERILLNPLPLPFENIHINEELSCELTRQDRAIIYDIRVGTIGSLL